MKKRIPLLYPATRYILIAGMILCGVSYVKTASAKDTASENAAKTSKVKTFNVQTAMLDNGLKIYVVENHRAPVITHMVWYRVGAADEAPGKSGIAHFLEHLMFKGQDHPKLGTFAPGEFSKTIRALGGEDNAFTSQDYTAYFQSIASKHLETVMTMEAGRMRHMSLPKDEVAAENKVVQEERRQRTDTKPSAQLAEQMNNVLFPNHPYGTPIIGWMHEIETLGWDDAKHFYRKHYAPNNAILVVSGDVKAKDVYAIAKRTYGLIAPADIPKRIRTSPPPFIGKSTVTVRHERVKEPTISRKYRVPSYRQNAEHALALQIIEEIMAGGSTSRLYKTIVTEQKLATHIGLSYNSAAWDDGTLSLSANVKSESDIEALETAVNEQLRLLVKNGVTEEERASAIKRMQAEAIYARDSVAGPAMIIGYNMITGSPLEAIEYWPYALEEVTLSQIKEVATLYLDPDNDAAAPYVTGLLLPQAAQDKGAQ